MRFKVRRCNSSFIFRWLLKLAVEEVHSIERGDHKLTWTRSPAGGADAIPKPSR